MNIFKACAGEVVRGVKAVGRIERILAPDNQKRPKPPPRKKANGAVKECPEACPDKIEIEVKR